LLDTIKIKKLKIDEWLEVGAEGLKQLETLCITEINVNGKPALKIPQLREVSQKLLDALQIRSQVIISPLPV
jgi:hypothetical protein